MIRRTRGNVGKWLLLCFPYGLYLMWKRGCKWHIAIKSLVSLLCAALSLAIILWPAPESRSGITIDFVGEEPAAEVYGPELPQKYDPSAFMVNTPDDMVFVEYQDEDTVYVYASMSEGSTYYHDSDCKYAYASSRRMTLYEAYVLKYTTPCGLCNPKIYDPETRTAKDNPAAAATAVAE